MKLIYIQLDYEAIVKRLQSKEELADFSLKPEIPLPYISYSDESQEGALDWNSIVNGIMYVALYEPKHEHSSYYKDFLLQLEPELPYILRERLQEQYQEQLWQQAQDTAHILIFLLPDAAWPLLELCYLYEQEAESAILRHRFQTCAEAWSLAELTYKQLLERDNMDARGYYQLGYYYLQCWNLPGAYQAFVSSQQLALSPENPLWGKCHNWLEKMRLFENRDAPEAQKLFRDLSRVQEKLHLALFGQPNSAPGDELENQPEQWLSLQGELNELLQEHSKSGFLWFLHGLCLLYGSNLDSPASQSFIRAQNLGWETALHWQLPYYEAVSYYLEGKYTEAEHKFLEVLRSNPEHEGALYWMEKLYDDREDERSNKYAKILQEWYPDFPDLLQDFL